MALLADDAKDRAEQLLLVSEQLTALIDLETQRIEARLPPLEGAEAEGGEIDGQEHRDEAVAEFAVADADDVVKEHADYVTKARGGRGAIREIIELLLGWQGKWAEVLEHYRRVIAVE